MTSGNDLIANNWEAAECEFYARGTDIAAGVAIGSLITGQFWASISASAAGLAFDYAAGLAGCKNNPGTPGGSATDGVNGCGESSTPATLQAWTVDQRGWTTSYGIIPDAYKTQVTKIVSVEKGTGGGPSYSLATVEINGDSTRTYQCNIDHGTLDQSQMYWRLVGGDCIDGGEPLPPDAIGQPTTVQDGDCNWTFTPKDSYIDATGAVRVYYVIEADNDACGGPFAYWSGPSGPTPVNPNPPDDQPDPIPPEPLPCCDDITKKLDELLDCACKPDRPELFRHWRSIRFESNESTPSSNRRLSKLFRYRGSSPGDVGRVADHWKDFRWVTGSTIVIHKGSPVGTPQVWARDADEGKRVIRHAFLEAGADADSVGEWIVTGPSGSRTGVSLEVGLLCVDGCWSATARPGSNGWPEAGVVTP